MEKNEREALEREIAECKHQCKEAWSTLLQLRKLISDYETHHQRWKRRLEKADRALAEQDRLTVCGKGARAKSNRPEIVLTRDQIVSLAERFGIAITFEDEESNESEE